MNKQITVLLTGMLFLSSSVFALDKPINDKRNNSTILVKNDVQFDKREVGKNPRLETAEKLSVKTQNRVHYLTSTGRTLTKTQAIERFGPTAFDVDGLDIVPLQKISKKKNHRETLTDYSRDEDVLWNLSYMNEDDAYYYLGTGSAADTFATVFTPAAPCVVKEVYYQWYSAGNCVAFGADFGNARNIVGSEFGDAFNVARGEAFYLDAAGDTVWASPIGTHRTTITPNTIAGYVSNWSADAYLDIGGEFVVGDSTDLSAVDQFVIATVKGGDTPQPLACSNDAIGKTTSYTWFGGPWTDGQWGRYSNQTDNMVLVKVTYPWGAPIGVDMSQPSNTYNASGTVTIEVDLFDDEDASGVAIDANDSLMYFYTAGGVTNTGTLTASAGVAANGNGIYTFDISYSLAAGNSVEYWVELVDNDDLASSSSPLSFSVVQPLSPAADVLLVYDNVDSDQEAIMAEALDNAGFVYEVWDVQANKGIDASVINFGWTNIIVTGWGVSSVPATDQDDPGYGAFVSGGGDLVLMDQDFFFGHGLAASPTFTTGDFMYDVFGIASGENDPMDAADENALHGDTLTVFGDDATTFDSPFVDPNGLDLNHTILETAGWTDLITPGAATTIFVDEDDNAVGTTMDHSTGGTASYLSFMPEAAVDWYIDNGDTLGLDLTQVDAFVGALLNYVAAVSPPVAELDLASSTRFGVVAGLSSASISGSAVDDGSVASAEAHFNITSGPSDSVGTEYTVGMTDDGNGDYSATIDLTTTVWTDSSTCTYWLLATDDGGLAEQSESGLFFGTTFVPTAGSVLYIFDYATYWTYGPSASDSSVMANMTAANVSYDRWSVYDNYQPDPSSVLSHYDKVIYTGVYDWNANPIDSDIHPLGEYVASGGYLLFSSEEALGTYTDWEDVSFGEGTFVHDVLGVEWVMNDIAYDSVNVKDVVSVTGGMNADELTMNASIDYFGSMADIVDPLGWGTEDQLPSPFETHDSGLPSWTGGAYDVSIENGSVVFMAFNLAMLPDSTQQAVIGNFVDWTINTPPSDFTMTSPVSQTVISITQANIATGSVDFTWTPSTDADGDAVQYDWGWVQPGAWYGGDSLTTNTTLSLSYQEVLDMITVQQDTTSWWWYVSASDGSDTTDAGPAPYYMTVNFDISDMLSIDGSAIPEEFALHQNYPNPFNPVTSIQFDIPEQSEVRMDIYNLMGQRVATLVNNTLEPGFHAVKWNGTNDFGKQLSSGMYIYRISANNFTSVKKLILMK